MPGKASRSDQCLFFWTKVTSIYMCTIWHFRLCTSHHGLGGKDSTYYLTTSSQSSRTPTPVPRLHSIDRQNTEISNISCTEAISKLFQAVKDTVLVADVSKNEPCPPKIDSGNHAHHQDEVLIEFPSKEKFSLN
jgi:hypothetical protein